MDTRTQAERAADAKAVKDDAARADAMRQSAALHARDNAGTATALESRRSAAERAKRRPAYVGPLTARLAVENEALAIEERAALALEEAEDEVGDDTLWWILTQVFTPDSLTRLLAQCRASVVKFAADAEVEKAAAKATEKAEKKPVVIPDDETAEQRRVRLAAAEKAKATHAPAQPIPDDETAEQRRVRLAAKPGVVTEPEEVIADPAEGTLNRFLARAIVAATESDNRP